MYQLELVAATAATPFDRRIIYAAAFLRATATGLIGVLLGIYLPQLGFSPEITGVLIALGLAGATVAAIFATFAGDRFGRRRLLISVAIFGAAGAALAAYGFEHTYAMGAALFVGMLNGMGRDRGASLVIEQAILPETTDDHGRTRVFAWYNVLQDAGHALGSLLAGGVDLLRKTAGVSEVRSLQWMVFVCAVLVLATSAVYLGLSKGIECRSPENVRVSRQSRRLLFKISALFAMDSLGGGFLTTSLLSYFFFERFGASATVIGLLFFGARVANALSHLGASWLAKRIGLVKTMVFTHIPSSLFLLGVAFAPNLTVAAALFLLGEVLVEMDVPTRQSYVMAVVRPEERTAASGITHVVRIGAWAVAPSFAGLFMADLSLATPLFFAAAIKISYDLLLYRAFHAVRPPEET